MFIASNKYNHEGKKNQQTTDTNDESNVNLQIFVCDKRCITNDKASVFQVILAICE